VGPRLAEYDHVVVGAGAMGSATAYYLAHSPGRTLVLERFYENHPFGSSHGRTRLLRTAYSEGPVFVPLVLRARSLWKLLGREAGREIFRPTGVLLAGRSGSSELAQARSSARSQALPHEMLDGREAAQRFRMFRFGADDAALWDPGGGILFPERAIHAFRQGASRRGVRFRWNSPVIRWNTRADGRVLLGTSRRDYLAGRVVFSAGAWLSGLVPDLPLPVVVEQQSVFWFVAPGPARRPFRQMPGFVWYQRNGEYFYGTPDFGEGVKVGGSEGQIVRNLARRPATSEREARAVRRFAQSRLLGISTKSVRRIRCLYTNTPDRNFIVDVHPDTPHIMLVSACSGHGFKFASAIGELVARGVTARALPTSLAPFRLPPTAGRP
jgi:sarcosine oxidase